MENDLDADLDTNWINEQTKLQNIQQNYFKEPLEQIKQYNIFINKNLYIDNIKCELIDVKKQPNTNQTIITQEQLLKIIQKYKTNKSTMNYKLKEILTYIVDIDTQQDIREYVLSETTITNNPFFKTYSNIVDEIKIPESIFIFHDINSIYFIFQERETIPQNQVYKSILKIDKRENDRKTTKKVRIQDKIQFSQPMKKKYTRKTKNMELNN